MVPENEPAQSRFPTLGPQVCDFIEEYLVYGPGVLKGDPYKIDNWLRALLYRIYEVFPQGHPLAGRRRFKLVCLSLKKGSSKTEIQAILAITEAHPEAPVRCDGFDAEGEPVGVGVSYPFIPMFAFSQEQSEELGFSVARTIIEESDPEFSRRFDVGMERIFVMDESGRENGKIIPVGNSPAARDGARTTFAAVDETHHLVLPRVKKAVMISRQNLFKRAGIYGSGWQFETTTSFSPGEGSVAEDTANYAAQVAAGTVADPGLFYFHRQADDDMPLDTQEQVKAALLEAAGPTALWSSDIDGLVSHWFEPNVDRAWYRRVWLNQPIAGAGRAFSRAEWDACQESIEPPEKGELVVLGFDGARKRDATALVAVDVERNHIFTLDIWEKPEYAEDDWEVPADEVDAMVEMAFETWDVWRMYADPPFWQDKLDQWAGQYGDKRVFSWWTNRPRPMAYALRNFREAMNTQAYSHDGNTHLGQHVFNSMRQLLTITDDEDRPLWNIRKERRDSPLKIDGAMAAVLAWEAAGDCIAAGKPRSRRSRQLVTF